MAKIINTIQKIFGSTGPTGSISIFGSKKAGSPIYSNNLDDIQSLNAWTNGFSDALIDGTKPTLQDLNAILYLLTYQNMYSQQRGIPEYDPLQEYFIGSIISVHGTAPGGSGSYWSLYCSKSNNNIGFTISDTTYWQLLYSNQIRSIGTTTPYTVTSTDWFLIWDLAAAQSGAGIILPSPSLCPGREIWIKYTNGSLGVVITVTATGGSSVLMMDSNGVDPAAACTIRYTNSIRLLSNGTNWISSIKMAVNE